MSLRVTMSVKLTCPKHRGYNPELTGEGGITGACSTCYMLLIFNREYTRFRELAAETEDQLQDLRNTQRALRKVASA